MKLSNALIIRLGNLGLANTHEHDLKVDAAYPVFRFRRDAMRVYRELAEHQAALRKEAGEDKAKFDELNAAFLKDTSEVYATPIGVQDFLLLSAENRRTPVPGKDTFVDFFHTFENDLEGILWADEIPAPESEVKP